MSDLSDDIWLYRAIVKRAWFDENTQQIQFVAFQLRWREKIQDFELGISTDINPELCYQYIDDLGKYRQRLSPCFGIIKVLVGEIRSLGLEVDNNHDSHVNIIGLPHPKEEEAKYFDILDRLSKKAKLHCLFDPPKRKPKKKK